MYLKNTDLSARESVIIKSNYRNVRQYSTTSKVVGPVWETGNMVLGKKLITFGTKLGAQAQAAKAPAAASKLVIGTQGITATGAGGTLVLLGGDQVIRYGVENGINSVTQQNHV